MGKNKYKYFKKQHKRRIKPAKREMHPRNIYKKKLDFIELGKQFQEFKDCLKQDLSGKINFSFKDEESLLVLAKVLLKRDFDLDVNIPKGFLIPTMPLRLNYILYIEDILNAIGPKETKNEICGIDIGTGASCIYPLLAARKNNWNMVGTDNDSDCVRIAQENVKANNLDSHIKVIKSEDKPLFGFVKDDDKVYDFCMCNPPFYDANEKNSRNKNKDRPLPHNAPTGKISEIAIDGGEGEFIHQMINESVELKTKIRVYTTMIGCKKNVPSLLKRLEEVEVKSMQQVEFYQGHVTRWCIAWTFCDYDFNKFDIFGVITEDKRMKIKEKPKKIYVLNVSDPRMSSDEIVEKMEYYFDKLDFAYSKYVRENTAVFEVQGFENTWSSQRQKHRKELQEKKIEESNMIELGKRPFVKSEEVAEKKVKREYDPDIQSLLHVRINLVHKSDDHEITLSNLNNDNNVLHQITQYFSNQFHTPIQVLTIP